MFSRGKLEKIRKTQPNVLKQSNINNYFKVIMNNQTQSINVLKCHLNANDEHNLRPKRKHNNDGGTEELEDLEILRDDRDLAEGDNNRILAKSVTLRKSKTPVESLMLQNMNFSFIKPNKNYVVEKSNETAKEGVVKNSVDDTFHNAARPIFFLGQCFALMPVMGMLSSDPKRLKFSYKSMQVILTLFFMCSSSVLTLTMLKFLIKSGINAKNFVGLAFFGCVQFSCTLFASLAQRWPKIMRYWSRVETIFTQPPYEMLKSGLTSRVRIAAYCIIFCSAVEHSLYLASAILSYKRSIELCTDVHNNTEEVSFEDYVHRNYNYVFEILPYNLFVSIFILIINGSCTFIWNYMDLFIMMVSKGIAYRFEQITKRINKLADKEIPETVFIEIREHYVKLCELLEFIDENLSGIILLSCINNLYFVCYQLLNVFNKLRWPINYIYFWYSLLYLIGRTAFVFLAAASINDESKGGLPVLRKVSSRTWCVEVERLIFEMTTQTVALSGKKFYFLTRRLLFGMAGTIVTYELVLLQFDEPNRAKGLPELCA